MKDQSIYDDGTYHVTRAVLATPTRFYPLANSTARIRRDPLWIGISMTAFALCAFGIYGDLMFPGEVATLALLAMVSLLGSINLGILVLDAPGHQPLMVIGSKRKIFSLYRAIRDAKIPDHPAVYFDNEDTP